MSSLQIQSSQLVNSIPSYHVQMSIKTFIAICLTIMLLSFISCLILVHKSYQKTKKIETDKIIKEEKNNLIEEELKNIKLIINLLQDEFLNKITEIENKNNIMSEQLLRIKFIKDKKETEMQLQEQDKHNLLIDEYKNLKDEINVVTHKFNYYNSKQDDNLNLLTEDLRKINMKVEKQQQINQEKNNLFSNEIKNLKNEIDEYSTDNIKYMSLKQNNKINLLEENIGIILNEVGQQKQITENNKNQCTRFSAFLDNFTIRNYVCNNHSYNIRLDDSTFVPFNCICRGIGTGVLRILYSIQQKFNIEHHDNKIKISQHLNEITSRHLFIEIRIIDEDKTTDVMNPLFKSIPLYILCLLFGIKIITFDGEDVTDLFESNFNSVKKYHERYYYNMKDNEYCHNKVNESKKILDICDVVIVREMFK